MQDSNNLWFLRLATFNQLNLYEKIAGADNLRSTSGTALGAGDRIVIIATGTTIKVYQNTTLGFSYNSATNFQTQTSGKILQLNAADRMSNTITWPLNLVSAPNTGGAADALEALTRMGE